MKNDKMIKMPFLLLVLLLPIITSCIDDWDIDWEKEKVKVDNVWLRHKRVISFTHSADVSKLDVDSHHGEYKLTGGSEFDLEVTIYEKKENDVFLTFEDGYLKAKSKSGSSCTIGSINGEIPNGINLIIDSGAGNLSLSNFNGLDVDLDIGAGKVNIDSCSIKNLDIDCGAGSMSFSLLKAQLIDIDCGTGSIKFTDVSAENIKADTGVGSISATDCVAENVDFNTGIGSINTDNCQFKNKDFSTGLGHID